MSKKVKLRSPGLRYRLLSFILLLFWIAHGIKHSLKHGVSDYLRLRILGNNRAGEKTKLWVHASSVGEVNAVTPLVSSLIARGENILFTSFTATGLRTIRQNFGEQVDASVIPFDFYWHCRRFFRLHQIKLGMVMETELWPELLYQARCHEIKLLQINARLSKKSLKTGPFVRRLLGRTLGYFSAIYTRVDDDRTNLLQLGTNPELIKLVGNLKTIGVDSRTWPRLIEQDYILLASSHSPEEQNFIAARPIELSHCLLVIAPRHPQRSHAIQQELQQQGLNFSVRSKAEAISPKTDVYLADTLGEMKPLMAHAQVVVMGGSFDQTTGGHNLLEPASLGCAILTGPSDSNVKIDIKLLANGVHQVTDIEQCWRVIGDLLDNPIETKRLGDEARSKLAQQPNIAQAYLRVIETWL